MPSEGPAGEDTRVWVGRVANGHEAEHASFLTWLNGPEAESIFQRKRLTEYVLTEENGVVSVTLKAPHTGDPRIMIDFLRYPGLWPEYWEFVRGGAPDDDPTSTLPPGAVKVHWRRAADSGTSG